MQTPNGTSRVERRGFFYFFERLAMAHSRHTPRETRYCLTPIRAFCFAMSIECDSYFQCYIN